MGLFLKPRNHICMRTYDLLFHDFLFGPVICCYFNGNSYCQLHSLWCKTLIKKIGNNPNQSCLNPVSHLGATESHSQVYTGQEEGKKKDIKEMEKEGESRLGGRALTSRRQK